MGLIKKRTYNYDTYREFKKGLFENLSRRDALSSLRHEKSHIEEAMRLGGYATGYRLTILKIFGIQLYRPEVRINARREDFAKIAMAPKRPSISDYKMAKQNDRRPKTKK